MHSAFLEICATRNGGVRYCPTSSRARVPRRGACANRRPPNKVKPSPAQAVYDSRVFLETSGNTIVTSPATVPACIFRRMFD